MQIRPNQPAPIMDRPAIDGLRGLACLIVLVFHAIAQNKPEWGVYITGTARLGVWLFFVLSAFLLTLRLSHKGFGRAGITDYVVARALRIIPLFVLAVLLYWWARMIGLVSQQDAVKALTFQAYYNHLWTIPIEFMFYGLLLPIVAAVAWLAARSVLASALALIGSILFCAAVFRPAHPDDIVFWNYLACFGWGILAAFAVRYLPKPSAGLCQAMALGGLTALVITVLTLKSGLVGPPTDAISDKYALFRALWALVVYGVYSTQAGISRVLAWRPLALFGLTIYSTYLFHWFPMHWVARTPSAWWWAMPAAIAVSIALGIAGYQMAERLLQHLRRPVVKLGAKKDARRFLTPRTAD